MLPVATSDRRNFLVNILKNNHVEITFTKVNGEVRVMPCTLQESSLPAKDPNKEIKERKVNDATLSVWCLDKNQWRSFRLETVTDYKILSK